MTRVVAGEILRELGLATDAPRVCIGGEWQKGTGSRWQVEDPTTDSDCNPRRSFNLVELERLSRFSIRVPHSAATGYRFYV